MLRPALKAPPAALPGLPVRRRLAAARGAEHLQRSPGLLLRSCPQTVGKADARLPLKGTSLRAGAVGPLCCLLSTLKAAEVPSILMAAIRNSAVSTDR